MSTTTRRINSIVMDREIPLLRLMQLISPSLPIGSFTYSQGIEYAVECGWIDSDDALRQWLEDQMQTSMMQLDLPILQRLYSAVELDDESAIERWSQILLVSRETAELRQEEINRGRALAGLLIALDVPSAKRRKPLLASCQAAGFATAAVGWKISYRETACGYVWSWLENLVLAAVKIIPLGQTQGQQLLNDMSGMVPDVVKGSMEVEDASIGASNPALAIASSRHETQYTRLFRS
ncbi:MAG: urease accessory protein UreF [Rhodothermales bacterium]